MMTNNFALYGTKILVEMGRDITYFPLWWYSRGLLSVVRQSMVFLGNRQKSLALLVWLKNIHKPMYGQRDWQGMLISIFMRIVQIIIKSIVMIFWLCAALVFLGFWITLPPFVLYEIFFQLKI